MKCAIAIDEWKLDIFVHNLTRSGFAYTKGPGLTRGTFLLTVETHNRQLLEDCVRRATRECNVSKGPKR